ARVFWSYDDAGRKILEAYAGLDDKSALRSDGCSWISWRYDERSNATEWVFDKDKRFIRKIFVDKDLKRRLDENGYAEMVPVYGKGGELVDVHYLDLQGKRVNTRVVLHGVTPGGVGDKLGLRAGDIVDRLGGQPVRDMYHFKALRDTQRGVRDLEV